MTELSLMTFARLALTLWRGLTGIGRCSRRARRAALADRAVGSVDLRVDVPVPGDRAARAPLQLLRAADHGVAVGQDPRAGGVLDGGVGPVAAEVRGRVADPAEALQAGCGEVHAGTDEVIAPARDLEVMRGPIERWDRHGERLRRVRRQREALVVARDRVGRDVLVHLARRHVAGLCRGRGEKRGRRQGDRQGDGLAHRGDSSVWICVHPHNRETPVSVTEFVARQVSSTS